MVFDRHYFLEQDSRPSKSHVLLAKKLTENDQMAIVHFALSNKTRLGTLRVRVLRQARGYSATHLVVARLNPLPQLTCARK